MVTGQACLLIRPAHSVGAPVRNAGRRLLGPRQQRLRRGRPRPDRGTTAAVTTTYAYDASGLLLTATAGTTRVAAFAYDAEGNRTSHT